MNQIAKFGRTLLTANNLEGCARVLLATPKRSVCKHDSKTTQYDEQESQFTDQELNLFKKLFLRFDRDENCKLDRWEFNHFAKYLVGRSYNSIDLEKVIERYDIDNDRYVDFNELMTYLSKRFRPQSKKRIAVAFNLFDKDSDGMVEYWEAKQAIFYLGENIIAEKLRYEFDLADDDQDGRLIFDQFVDVLCSLRKKCPQICPQTVYCEPTAPECPDKTK